MLKSNYVKYCRKISHKVRNTGTCKQNTNLTDHSSNELEILYISRFPSDLVHRHTILLLTLLLLEKKMIISPDIIMQAMLMSKQVNAVNS